jgi:hypothetical protein
VLVFAERWLAMPIDAARGFNTEQHPQSHSWQSRAMLLSRNGSDWTRRYPWIAEAALKNRQKHLDAGIDSSGPQEDAASTWRSRRV